jgi:hypothetical protein
MSARAGLTRINDRLFRTGYHYGLFVVVFIALEYMGVTFAADSPGTRSVRRPAKEV